MAQHERQSLGEVLEENFQLGDQIEVYSPGFTAPATTNPMTGMYISSEDNWLNWSTASAAAPAGVVAVWTDLTGASVVKL